MTLRMRILVALLALALTGAGPADDGRWYAGAYSFSDELGGFHILSVTGSGTRSDPVVITEEFLSADAVTLVIRPAREHASRQALTSPPSEGALHIRIVARNGSELAWIEFEFELQEIRGKPSDFYDGLSFDQPGRNRDYISADRFAGFEDHFESYDRLRFHEGHVDPRDRATFGFFITDVTPAPEFYLVQDPSIPFS